MSKKKIRTKDVTAIKALVKEQIATGAKAVDAFKVVGEKLGFTLHQVQHYYYRKPSHKLGKPRAPRKTTVTQKVEKIKSKHIIPMSILDSITITKDSVTLCYK